MLPENYRSDISIAEDLDQISLNSSYQEDSQRIAFYCAEYEEELLSKYFGESYSEVYLDKSASMSIGNPSDVLDDYQPTIDDFLNPPLPPINFNESYESFESDDVPILSAPKKKPTVVVEVPKPRTKVEAPRIKVEVSSPRIKVEVPSRRKCAAVAPYVVPASPDKEKHRRGRPNRANSNSKMANYARQYREMKKMQLEESAKQVVNLQAENEELRKQLGELLSGYKELEKEVSRLRFIVSNDSCSSDLALKDSKKFELY